MREQAVTRVWVTGANGFLGRWVCSAFEERGFDVTRVVRARSHIEDDRTRAEQDSPVSAVVWDLLHPWSGSCAPPHAVVHLAAVVPRSFQGPDAERAAEENLRVDRNVLRACTSFGCQLVYASGCSVYGSRTAQWQGEDARCEPLGPYPAQKLVTEAEGAALDARHALRFASLRVSAPYAPRQPARTVLQLFASRAAAGQDLVFHGDGTREQDFIHAKDVAAAFVAAVQRTARGTFNIGAGAPITMKDLAERVARLAGSGSPIRASGQADPQQELRARYAIERARRELGWAPRIGLDEGLTECIDFYRGHV